MPEHKAKIISSEILRAGDVLLCYEARKIDPTGKIISHVTESRYTHAAICYDTLQAAESVLFKGVAKVATNELISRYDHVAVFRQPDAWPRERAEDLREFIDAIAGSGAKYNFEGIVKFIKRKNLHDITLKQQLHSYFSGDPCPTPSFKERYFCSELVVDCFVATGFIQPSAAVVYQSVVTSPGALGRDPTFGTFCGYATCKPDYEVPPTDEFFNETIFDEIFGKST